MKHVKGWPIRKSHYVFFLSVLFCCVVDSFLGIWVGETRFCRVLDRIGRSHR